MKVIFAGFSKCGTKTMAEALKALGYKVYDYPENFIYLRDEWMEIVNQPNTIEGFYKMYKDVDASCDVPFCYFWEEILEAFPGAKVARFELQYKNFFIHILMYALSRTPGSLLGMHDITIILTKRNDEEEWLKSWERQSKSLEDNYFYKSLCFFSPTAYRFFQYHRFVARIVFSASPQPFWASYIGISKAVAKKRYRDHNLSVLQKAPKDRLLVFSLSDGWEPLCKFLEKPVPNIEFPHKNKQASLLGEFIKKSPLYRRMKREAVVTLSLLSILAVTVCFYFYRHTPKSFFQCFSANPWLQMFSIPIAK